MRRLIVPLKTKKAKSAIKRIMQDFRLEKGEYEKTPKTFTLFYKRPYIFTDIRWELHHKKIDYEETE